MLQPRSAQDGKENRTRRSSPFAAAKDSMEKVFYYSTNNKSERADFETALLNGMASNYGLYMLARKDIPKLTPAEIYGMKGKPYADIAFDVLNPFIGAEIPEEKLRQILNDAYSETVIPTKIQNVWGRAHIMWLTQGPTYSFKDYAARFYARCLDHFLEKRGERKTVIVATSGDTGGAIADALHGLKNVDVIVLYPKGEVSPGQRRQMTVLGGNVHAFEVNGDFDVCQALAKLLIADVEFQRELFNGQKCSFTSANSISIGRLLPQAVYPFFAYSRTFGYPGDEMYASPPSGNFGDMMGTVIAKEMGLPIPRIICGVNANITFPRFMNTGQYIVGKTMKSPSSAMRVSHPSNVARAFDFYNGHIYDERGPDGKVIKEGIIDIMPDMDAMHRDIYSTSIDDNLCYETIRKVYERFGIILEPHGAVGWAAMERMFPNAAIDKPFVMVYETADPGKLRDEVFEALKIRPEPPPRMKAQEGMPEIINLISSAPDTGKDEKLILSSAQIAEAKEKITKLFSH